MSYYKDSDYSDKPENRDPNTDQVVHSRRARRMEREAAEQKAEHTPHRAQREHVSRAQNTQAEASPDNGSQKHHRKEKTQTQQEAILEVCRMRNFGSRAARHDLRRRDYHQSA